MYLHAYETVADASSGIAGYIEFYNHERPHSSLDKQTPDEAYCMQRAWQAAYLQTSSTYVCRSGVQNIGAASDAIANIVRRAYNTDAIQHR